MTGPDQSGSSPSAPDRTVTVLGAGIVGVSCALHLQERGWSVSLIDRKPPGSETSFGNAGVISDSAIAPANTPALWRALPAYARNRGPTVTYDPAFLTRNALWFARYLAHANTRSATRRASAIAPLVKTSIREHEALIVAAGVHHRLRRTGWFKLYRTAAAFEHAGFERQLLAHHDVSFDIMTGRQIQEIEPDLAPVFAKGCLYSSAISVDGPGAVTAAFARLFADRGGRIMRAELKAIRPQADGFCLSLRPAPHDSNDEAEASSTSLDQSSGTVTTSHVVVALGPWSMDVLKPLGLSIPLAFERGYHQHFTVEDSATLSRPCNDVSAGYALIPMKDGYRLTTGVELAPRDAPASPTQLQQVIPLARQAFALSAPTNEHIWKGARPSLPDGLPVIGAAPGIKHLWLAFGHGHNGFGLGPATGRALAELMSTGRSTIDISSLAPHRFS